MNKLDCDSNNLAVDVVLVKVSTSGKVVENTKNQQGWHIVRDNRKLRMNTNHVNINTHNWDDLKSGKELMNSRPKETKG